VSAVSTSLIVCGLRAPYTAMLEACTNRGVVGSFSAARSRLATASTLTLRARPRRAKHSGGMMAARWITALGATCFSRASTAAGSVRSA